MRAPRWVHRLYAKLAGYFWEPCPLCGRHFGGHEWRFDLDCIPKERGPGWATSEGVCDHHDDHPLVQAFRSGRP